MRENYLTMCIQTSQRKNHDVNNLNLAFNDENTFKILIKCFLKSTNLYGNSNGVRWKFYTYNFP